MQRAQPIRLSHHLLAYDEMLERDHQRFTECLARVNVLPLGAGALATTTYPIDRSYVAQLLDFPALAENSLDAVSDRDFVIECCGDAALIMMHLSRLSQELTLWCSAEFGFIELSDAFSTGSSIMPQKKNPDVAELVRGKTGRVYGHLQAVLTVMKGLPLAYNSDMQEDKEALFDVIDTVTACLRVFAPMLATLTIRPERMRSAAAEGFGTATDMADYLAAKGLPFRQAHESVGHIVRHCLDQPADPGRPEPGGTPDVFAAVRERHIRGHCAGRVGGSPPGARRPGTCSRHRASQDHPCGQGLVGRCAARCWR